MAQGLLLGIKKQNKFSVVVFFSTFNPGFNNHNARLSFHPPKVVRKEAAILPV